MYPHDAAQAQTSCSSQRARQTIAGSDAPLKPFATQQPHRELDGPASQHTHTHQKASQGMRLPSFDNDPVISLGILFYFYYNITIRNQ